jgi:hypothetical protein
VKGEQRELTLRALVGGSLLGIVFAASSVYLGLKVGLTVSASIPVAVISITLFRLLSKFGSRDASILENNIVQTAGSAGESIAFGVGVTMPAILILGFDLELTRVLLVAVLSPYGKTRMGAQRWVFGVQPSEIAKLSVILFVAWLLGRRESARGGTAYVATLAVVAVPMLLVMRQPDLGTALVFVPTVLAMLFAANVAPRAFWLVNLIGAIVLSLVVAVIVLAENRKWPPRTEAFLRQATCLTDYQQDRIANFIYPDRNTRGGACRSLMMSPRRAAAPKKNGPLMRKISTPGGFLSGPW